ncbi:MAG: hypothetical protein ACE5HP_11485 [Gemmatimonadota bacterium]
MRTYLVFLLLLAIKGGSRLFFRHEIGWVGVVPPDRWARIRILAMLNHTSLFEPVLAGGAPASLLWRIARHGVVPVADKTARRPVLGRLFRLMARQVIPITRQRDETWETVMARVEDPSALVAILPEGRMRRRTGLDSEGRPLTVRGGIADILRAIPRGRMLLVYSGGLHHIHAPGDRFPRIFKTVRMCLEAVEIPAYREARLAEGGTVAFKGAVIRDLARRRDRFCPVRDDTSARPEEPAP